MGNSLRRRLAAGLAVTGVVISPGLVAGEALAAGAPPGDVAVGTRLAAESDPAVQLIALDYTATVVVPRAGPRRTFAALQAQAERHAKAKRIPGDRQSQMKWVLRKAAADVDRYLRPAGDDRRVRSGYGGFCTGWWITSDGYMVTGSHCVGSPKAALRQGFAGKALPKIGDGDVRTFLKEISQVAQADDELIRLTRNMFDRFNVKHMRVTGLKRYISLVSPLPGGGMDRTAKIRPLKLVARGRDYPGEDFALLKLAGARNLPTVPLGRDTDVRVGDTLYINGFPGLITSSTVFDLRSKLYPALTEGAYNAKRTTVWNVPYIQAQAPSYKGNSGGPVFSREGKVVGMLIAGSPEPDGGVTENHSFILPVNIVRKRLAAAGVTARQSLTSRVYDSALDDFFAHRYRAALPKFRKVHALYPAHPYVAGYIADSRKAIAAGKDRTGR
ncbi:serine protease [Planobispora siamensis]|uniref:Trypsin-like peptidase domain-containing protein n=1 Tax=Planobispora siamensis TaxID=936338 RepID=A0A8J3SIA3_9ACTN|nr:serine protease [Planobispora siamensis]GIH92694.1 hypothetical protein Psi01_33240 [Planobispora siamensis]